ncbi:MAG: ATP-dependent DNA helicase, partial [Pseudomonadota bacterium]
MSDVAAFSDPRERLTSLPVVEVTRSGGHFLDAHGEFITCDLDETASRLSATPHLICARSWAGRLLRVNTQACFDILELAAFVLPARLFTPTTRGLARLLEMPAPADSEAALLFLREAAARLLSMPLSPGYPHRTGFSSLAMTMAQSSWPWGTWLMGTASAMKEDRRAVFDVLPQWESEPPPPPARDVVLREDAVLGQLTAFLPKDAEDREGQRAYARASTHAFAPRQQADAPNVLLSEAGTGIGKTLGYAAAAARWAREAEGPVWIATYTRALQRQIDQELTPFYLDRRRKLVVRKGRENYLCLLNMDEALAYAKGGAARDGDGALIGLVARWMLATRDGDLVGGDFPAWLAAQFGSNRTASLTDRRGECIYSACRHYRRCFIEHAQRKSARADIVIANHAVVMVQAARATDVRTMPTRLVFDEAHHVFDAADSAFCAFLSGQEMADLRRWLLGGDGTRRGRGLDARLGDLIYDQKDMADALTAVLDEARFLPNEGWLGRLREDANFGPAEAFLAATRAQILARAQPGPYDLEAAVTPPTPALVETSAALLEALSALRQPLLALMAALSPPDEEEGQTRQMDRDASARMDGMLRLLDYRVGAVDAWCHMLSSIASPGDDETVVDWLSLSRMYGRDVDVGLRRHFIDPTKPFAEVALKNTHGVLLTSATLRDKLPEEEAGDNDAWRSADVRTGAQHLILPAKRFSAKSPFDYGANTRLIVVTDVDKQDSARVAHAYRQLFLASKGGALGLFTAIARLSRVHAATFEDLLGAGLNLYGQHVDPMDPGALIDIFREDIDSCLLGTDALRDGIDVPGRALRLIVMDRVPWPRPSILHRARRSAFGGRSYDDMLARFKLIQAYGRLIRRSDDRGVFFFFFMPTTITCCTNLYTHHRGLIRGSGETQ